MADASLKDRLRDHSEAFDSLLSLIPAKIYYGEDPSDRWQRMKQTKEQARAAKRGRLDPDSALNRNAKEVLDERARKKRKAEEMEAESSQDNDYDVDDEDEDEDEDEDDSEVSLDGIQKEQPQQGLKKRKTPDQDAPSKKARLVEGGQPETSTSAKLSAHQERKLLKKQKKADKRAEKKKTKLETPPRKMVGPMDNDGTASENGQGGSSLHEPAATLREANGKGQETVKDNDKDVRHIDISGLVDVDDGNRSSQSSTLNSPTFDSATDRIPAERASTTTSIASEAAGADRVTSSSKKLKVPSDTTELRARLAARIAALRAARKADGPDGAPIRTRQELIESRRKKQAERKAHKKELRQQVKEAEDRIREEALASARNSPMLSFGSPGSPEQETNFSFGRVAFADGTQMSQDLSYIKDKSGKKKGPQDPKGALAKLEAQKRRLAALDADKRKEVLEKETWLAARKRAEGEKVRNDESLLKKAVKRKEKTKKKSASEWAERTDGVKRAQKQRQQRREDNIRKRKDTKVAGKAGKKGKGKSPTKKSRPGFEGGGFGGKRR